MRGCRETQREVRNLLVDSCSQCFIQWTPPFLTFLRPAEDWA